MLNRLRELIDRVATARRILIAGWLWFLVYAYPGYMSYDSTWQLSQARHLEPVNDWHPPMMGFIWHFTDALVAGPFPMLVLQSVAFLLGMDVLLRRVMSVRAAAIVAVVLLLVPQNIVVMSVIWKDSQMAGFLVAAIAALFSTQRRWRIAGYVFIFLATAVRYNAAAATLPIVMLQFGWGGTMPWLKRYALGAALWVGITVASFMVNGALVEHHLYPWPTAAAPVDIAGIIRYSPHLDNDELLRDTPGVPWAKTDKIQIRARTWYRPENQFLNITQEPGQIFNYPTTDEERAGITAAWKKLVFAHPLAFLHHRWSVFWAQLVNNGGGAGGVYSGFTNPVYDELLQHRAVHSSVQEFWIHRMEWFDGTLMYQVSLYFALTLLFLPMCRKNRPAFVVLVSGFMHMMGLFAVAPAIDYRYSQWMVACALLGGVLIFATRFRRVST